MWLSCIHVVALHLYIFANLRKVMSRIFGHLEIYIIHFMTISVSYFRTVIQIFANNLEKNLKYV